MRYPRLFEEALFYTAAHPQQPQLEHIKTVIASPEFTIWDVGDIGEAHANFVKLYNQNRHDPDFARAIDTQLVIPSAAFWLEYTFEDVRIAYVCQRGQYSSEVTFIEIEKRGNELKSSPVRGANLFAGPGNFGATLAGGEQYQTHDLGFLVWFINEPTLRTARTVHRHKGLERKAKKFQLGELKGFTKISQPIHSEPKQGSPRAAHQKAQHWCRSPLRFVRGGFTNVIGHWRGNPELGRTIGIRKCN